MLVQLFTYSNVQQILTNIADENAAEMAKQTRIRDQGPNNDDQDKRRRPSRNLVRRNNNVRVCSVCSDRFHP